MLLSMGCQRSQAGSLSYLLMVPPHSESGRSKESDSSLEGRNLLQQVRGSWSPDMATS